MATLATMYNRILGNSRMETGVAHPPMQMAKDDAYVLRALPNEDVYFFVKEIDNSRVVRQADPGERRTAWKVVASGGMIAAAVICLLLPSAYGLLAGYKVESLRSEQDSLLRDKSKLELEEAWLMTPARLEELARIQSFVDPAPQKVIYLDKAGALALNVKK